MSINELPEPPTPKKGGMLEKFVMHGLEQSQKKVAEDISPEYMQRRLELLTEQLSTARNPGAANTRYVNHLKKMRMLKIPYDTSVHLNE